MRATNANSPISVPRATTIIARKNLLMPGPRPNSLLSKNTYQPERLLCAGAIETSTSLEIDATRVSVPKHFGHSKVRKSKPGLSGSMIRNTIISPHVEQRGFSITSMNTAHSPDRQCTIGRALRKSYVLKVTDVWKSDGRLRSNHERVFGI